MKSLFVSVVAVLCALLASPSSTFAQQICDTGNPLGGWIRLRYSEVHMCEFAVTVVLRFDLVPTLETTTSLLAGAFSPTQVRYEIRTGGCAGPNISFPHSLETCRVAGGQKSGTIPMGKLEAVLGTGGRIYVPNPMAGYLTFHPLEPELSLQLNDPNTSDHPGFNSSYRCVYGGGGGTGGFGVQITNMDFRPGPLSENRFDNTQVVVKGTPCSNPQSEAQRRDCAMRPERYAVMPFRGRYSWRNPIPLSPSDPYLVRSRDVSWDVCCGCASISGAHY